MRDGGRDVLLKSPATSTSSRSTQRARRYMTVVDTPIRIDDPTAASLL